MNRADSASIESQLEREWCWLSEQPPGRRIRFFLTSDGRLKRGEGQGEEVGTFTRSVQLLDFREAVFEAYALLRRAVHGRA